MKVLRIATAFLLLAVAATAHDSPNVVIDKLSHRIEDRGPSPRLLTSRAFEYRVIGEFDAAIADFQAALEIDKDYAPALHGLAAAYFRNHDYAKAESVVRQGLAQSAAPTDRAPYYAVLAQCQSAQQDWSAALESWRAALESKRPEVDWFIGEAQCLQRLGRLEERSEALANAKSRNSSAVLERLWLGALVDTGQFEEAGAVIQREMENTRWKSSWLLLKARLERNRGNDKDARAAASQALQEIRTRQNHDNPDPYLVAEAAQAHALLGNHATARDLRDQAHNLGVPDLWLTETDSYLKRP